MFFYCLSIYVPKNNLHYSKNIYINVHGSWSNIHWTNPMWRIVCIPNINKYIIGCTERSWPLNRVNCLYFRVPKNETVTARNVIHNNSRGCDEQWPFFFVIYLFFFFFLLLFLSCRTRTTRRTIAFSINTIIIILTVVLCSDSTVPSYPRNREIVRLLDKKLIFIKTNTESHI